MGYNRYALFIMVAIVSFLGFLTENIWLLFTKGIMDNRNMYAPFLLGYGILIVMIYLLIGTPQNCVLHRFIKHKLSNKRKYFLYFGLCFLIVCIGELFLGLTVEKVSGIQYWNYSWIPLHFTQYTSVPTSAGFALIMTFFMGRCFEPIMNMIMKMDPLIIKVVGTVLMIIMCSDFFASFYQMIKKRAHIVRWCVRFR